MKKSTADHYNAIARGEKTVEQALAPMFSQILSGIQPPVFRIPELTNEEQQLPNFVASSPCIAAHFGVSQANVSMIKNGWIWYEGRRHRGWGPKAAQQEKVGCIE